MTATAPWLLSWLAPSAATDAAGCFADPTHRCMPEVQFQPGPWIPTALRRAEALLLRPAIAATTTDLWNHMCWCCCSRGQGRPSVRHKSGSDLASACLPRHHRWPCCPPVSAPNGAIRSTSLTSPKQSRPLHLSFKTIVVMAQPAPPNQWSRSDHFVYHCSELRPSIRNSAITG